MNNNTPLHVVLACGGTGGHINPALALAERLLQEGHRCSLILSGTRKAEAQAERTWQGPLLKSGARPPKDPRNLLAFLRCRRFLKAARPDVLFATGGYTSLAPVCAARSLGIPVVLHEANSLAGKATRLLSRLFSIATVATSFPETAATLPWARTRYTGLPLRQSVLAALEKAQATPKPTQGLSILVTGGSQGAHGLNLLVAPILASLAKSDPAVTILHQCGQADLPALEALYAATPGQITLTPFIEDIGSAYGRADLVIARAGAATCFELARCALPTLFIPLPTAADDHQRKNAEALVRCGGALCISQTAPTAAAQLAEALRQLHADPALRASMHAALAALPRPDAAGELLQILREAARPAPPPRA